jgi:excisionase family DNA binding protein
MTVLPGQLALDVPDVAADPLADLDLAHAARVLAAELPPVPTMPPACHCDRPLPMVDEEVGRSGAACAGGRREDGGALPGRHPRPAIPHPERTRRGTARPGSERSRGVTQPLAAALLAELDDAGLEHLADRLAPLLEERLDRREDEWLTTAEAARYLRVGVRTLYREAKAGRVPAHQDAGPGGKYAFRRSELDAWRRGQ